MPAKTESKKAKKETKVIRLTSENLKKMGATYIEYKPQEPPAADLMPLGPQALIPRKPMVYVESHDENDWVLGSRNTYVLDEIGHKYFRRHNIVGPRGVFPAILHVSNGPLTIECENITGKIFIISRGNGPINIRVNEKMQGSISIDTTGISGANGIDADQQKPEKAGNGQNGADAISDLMHGHVFAQPGGFGFQGTPGGFGHRGGDGGDGADVNVYAAFLKGSLQIYSDGGNGGRGGYGGLGGDGGNGGNGGDGRPLSSKGGQGGNAGDGADGGNAGLPGQGGRPGRVLVEGSCAADSIPFVSCLAGPVGGEGIGGKAGKAGQVGQPGPGGTTYWPMPGDPGRAGIDGTDGINRTRTQNIADGIVDFRMTIIY